MRKFSARTLLAPLYMGSALNPINSALIATALVPHRRRDARVGGSNINLDIGPLPRECGGAANGGKVGRRVWSATGVSCGDRHRSAWRSGWRRPRANLTTLIVSRVLIGIGTSAGYPTAMLIIRRRSEGAGPRPTTERCSRWFSDSELRHVGGRTSPWRVCSSVCGDGVRRSTSTFPSRSSHSLPRRCGFPSTGRSTRRDGGTK